MTKLLHYFIFLWSYFLSAPLAYSHHQKECLSSSVVSSILSGLTLYSWEATSQTWIHNEPLNLCDLQAPKLSVVQALIYMDDLENNSKHNDFSPTSLAFKEGALSFFKTRVNDIYFEPETQTICRPKVLAYVLSNETHSIHICLNNYKDSNSTVLKMSSTLIHEAHHLNGFKHVICNQGRHLDNDMISDSKRRSYACDEDYESQGSYGLETAYYIDIYKTTQNPLEKFMARMSVISNFLIKFNKLPLEIKLGNLLVTEKKDVLFSPYSNKPIDAISTESQKESNTIFKSTIPIPPHKPPLENKSYSKILNINNTVNALTLSDNKLYFYNSTGTVSVYGHRRNLMVAKDPFSAFYKNDLKAHHKSLLDVVYSSHDIDYGCFLFKETLICKDKAIIKTHKIYLSTIKPHGFYLYKNATTRRQYLFILDQDSKAILLPNQFNVLSQLSERELLNFSETNYNNGELSLNSHPEIKDPFLLLPTFIHYQPSFFIPQILNLPTENILEKIKAQSTWVLGPFYWSSKIESL